MLGSGYISGDSLIVIVCALNLAIAVRATGEEEPLIYRDERTEPDNFYNDYPGLITRHNYRHRRNRFDIPDESVIDSRAIVERIYDDGNRSNGRFYYPHERDDDDDDYYDNNYYGRFRKDLYEKRSRNDGIYEEIDGVNGRPRILKYAIVDRPATDLYGKYINDKEDYIDDNSDYNYEPMGSEIFPISVSPAGKRSFETNQRRTLTDEELEEIVKRALAVAERRINEKRNLLTKKFSYVNNNENDQMIGRFSSSRLTDRYINPDIGIFRGKDKPNGSIGDVDGFAIVAASGGIKNEEGEGDEAAIAMDDDLVLTSVIEGEEKEKEDGEGEEEENEELEKREKETEKNDGKSAPEDSASGSQTEASSTPEMELDSETALTDIEEYVNEPPLPTEEMLELAEKTIDETTTTTTTTTLQP